VYWSCFPSHIVETFDFRCVETFPRFEICDVSCPCTGTATIDMPRIGPLTVPPFFWCGS
jgi:hypothetical protein